MLFELLSIFILSLLFIKLIIIYAEPLGLVDIPNDRSMHTRHHPRGAGIGFFLAVAIIDPCFDFQLILGHYLTCLAVIAVFIVGVLDDHHDTSPKTKFIVLSIASLMVYFDGIYVSNLGVLFGFDMALGWLTLPFTIVAIVGFTNALNLIDGLDGLAGLVSIVILGALLSIGIGYNDPFIIVLSASFIASLLAFMVYNWNPASIFMGDSGSLTLGFIIGLLVIKAAAYIHPVTVLFILAVPLIDTIVVMVRRKRLGKSMFEADKTHIHHILYNFFDKNIKKTVIFIVVLQIIYTLTGLLMIEAADQSISLVLFGLNIILLYFALTGMLRRQAMIDKIEK